MRTSKIFARVKNEILDNNRKCPIELISAGTREEGYMSGITDFRLSDAN